MTLTAYPNGISSFGLPVVGGAFTSTGKVFFVDSNTGSNSYDGRDKDHPFATLDYAVGKCTASKGDIIYCMPGHAETLDSDSGVDLDVAGVSVVGLGHGSDRPTFTLGTSVTCDFKLAANGVTIENLYFKAGVDALTGSIEVSSSNCGIYNCEYKDTTGTYQTVDVVVTTTDGKGLTVDGFVYRDEADGNQSVINLIGADRAVVKNCVIFAKSATAVIEGYTCNAPQEVLIMNNYLLSLATTVSAPCVLPGSSCTAGHCTGLIIGNYGGINVDGEENLFGSSSSTNFYVGYFENYAANQPGETGFLPGVVSTSA